MQDMHVAEGDLNAELLDCFPVIRAIAGDGQYAEFRPDRRLARMYGPDKPARVSEAPPVLWVRVPDYGPETVGRLLSLVTESDARRRAGQGAPASRV